jgi:hypothetical protein
VRPSKPKPCREYVRCANKNTTITTTVITRLDRVIHAMPSHSSRRGAHARSRHDMDGRVKPGHDGGRIPAMTECGLSSLPRHPHRHHPA